MPSLTSWNTSLSNIPVKTSTLLLSLSQERTREDLEVSTHCFASVCIFLCIFLLPLDIQTRLTVALTVVFVVTILFFHNF